MKTRKITFEINEKGCHNCTSHAGNKFGYPQIMINGKRMYMHRYFYEQKYGIIPESLVVRHKCDNPSCININHLEVGTQSDNLNDIIKRGRSNPSILKGSLNKNSKLKEEEVIIIKKELKKDDSNNNALNLSKRFNVSLSTINAIKEGRNWSHINVT